MCKSLNAILLLVVLITGCQGHAQGTLGSMEFLLGTWKKENKETYENWKKASASAFEGETFVIREGSKKVLETLELRSEDASITYRATVPDQNEGRTIPFSLNKVGYDLFSFENPEHDFPKKIQYQLISSDTLLVRVLGEGEQGFSFRLIRQSQPDN